MDKKVKGAVSVVRVSGNSKIGPIAATYAAQSTCPAACPLRDNGCYAEHGPLGFLSRQRNDNAAGMDAYSVLREEAAAIDELPRGGMLRVHVVGDVLDATGAAIIAGAMARYDRRGGRSWTYTHAWREIPRAVWGRVNVLASCETAEDVRLAQSSGYAAALVVSEHAGAKVYEQAGLRLLPCVEQTTGRTCQECGICTRGAWLEATGTVIAFAAHGARRKHVQKLVKGEA